MTTETEWKARAEAAERERDEWKARADEYRASAEKCYEAWQKITVTREDETGSNA